MRYSRAKRVERENVKPGEQRRAVAPPIGSGKVAKEGITATLCLEGRPGRAVRTGHFDRTNGLVDKTVEQTDEATNQQTTCNQTKEHTSVAKIREG